MKQKVTYVELCFRAPGGGENTFFFWRGAQRKTRLGYINTNLAQASHPRQSGQTRTTDASKGRRFTSYSSYGEAIKWQA